MQVKVVATTKKDYLAPKEEFDYFAGQSAGICYMPEDFETLKNEPAEKTMRRANLTKGGGHHSVFGHSYLTLDLENIPKLFAMFLNNEKMFNTSEKSARYTHMNLPPEQKETYDKWNKKLFDLIKSKYGNVPYFDDKRINKIAMENARYFTSVMTPTSMRYTVSFQQLNYMCGWMTKFGEKQHEFYKMLKPTADEFLNKMKDYGYLDEQLMNDRKGREFSLLSKRARQEQFGEVYSINYKMSYAGLAQAHRHRTLSYEMQRTEEKEYFVPKILNEFPELVDEWLLDMKSLAFVVPQGELVAVNERGTYENLILKANERLCTAAQLEIMENTNATMKRIIQNTDNEFVREDLSKYVDKARCQSGYPCSQPCGFKEGIDLTREI